MDLLICKENGVGINPAYIIIPDISGFTAYISNSNLEHSQVRIATLLASILNHNILKLKVAKI